MVVNALGTDRRVVYFLVAGDGKYVRIGCSENPYKRVCRELVEMGYMKQHRTTEMLPYFNCSVTDEGIKAMREESPAPPKLSRSQQRYREFLRADCGYSFIEWLKFQKEARA